MLKLTAKKVEHPRLPGFFGDGEGLYLKVGRGGGRWESTSARPRYRPRNGNQAAPGGMVMQSLRALRSHSGASQRRSWSARMAG